MGGKAMLMPRERGIMRLVDTALLERQRSNFCDEIPEFFCSGRAFNISIIRNFTAFFMAATRYFVIITP